MSVFHKVDDIAEEAAKRRRESARQTAAEIVFVHMAESGDAFDPITLGEHAALFESWTCPKDYAAGQIREYDGRLYKCVQAHISQDDWTPDKSASLWSLTHNPAEEWPEWAAPIGAHDAYSAGDKATHSGKRWTSTADGNVWEPGVYGWEEVK